MSDLVARYSSRFLSTWLIRPSSFPAYLMPPDLASLTTATVRCLTHPDNKDLLFASDCESVESFDLEEPNLPRK